MGSPPAVVRAEKDLSPGLVAHHLRVVRAEKDLSPGLVAHHLRVVRAEKDLSPAWWLTTCG